MPSKIIFWPMLTKVCFGSLMIVEGSKLREERFTREKQVADEQGGLGEQDKSSVQMKMQRRGWSPENLKNSTYFVGISNS